MRNDNMILEWFRNGDEFGYRLKTRNGQVMLTSGWYSSYRKCVEGWRTTQKHLKIWDGLIAYRWSKEMLNASHER